MSTRIAASILLVAGSASLAAQGPAAHWWSHVAFLADDRMKGRETGSAEHREAAEYIAKHFKDAGLQPGGTNGYFQPVPFTSRKIVESKSSLALVRASAVVPVVQGDEATFSMRIAPAEHVEAPMVFAGYGLQVPEAKHDDLAGLDLKSKVVLLLTGGPSSIPGPLLAYYQNARWSYLKAAGAIGVASIQNPKGQDIPWERSKLARFLPSMSIADPAFDETTGQQLAITINPASAEKFFEGSGHSFKEILALSNAGQVLPRFAIPSSIRATVVTESARVTSDNVVGILPGTDPVLKNEYVVVSAHLDHIGVGTMNGDKIYNGAMDNASGIATLIETAAAAAKKPFKRSVIFLAVTAEEKGLLGSRYYANKPTVAARSLVADLNTDMFLPLFPLKSLIVQGLEESDLAADLRNAARPMGIEVYSDPEPERNAFVRSDQYSFIRTGVPSISLKVGFTKGSPEHEIVKRWRTERYHAPSDDLLQPIDRQAAEDFNRVYVALLEAVANRPTRPAWNADSFFKRFEKRGTAPSPNASKILRTSDGHPDLHGTWTNATITPFERPAALGDKAFLSEEEAAALERDAASRREEDGPPRAGDVGSYNQFWFDSGERVVSTRRTSLVIDPPDGRVPLRPEAETARDYARAHEGDSYDFMSVWDRCITRGVPGGMFPAGYNNAYEIVQTRGYVVIHYEMIHEARVIPTDSRPHVPSRIRSWNGDPRGRWEGDTFVVETTNYNNKGWIATQAAGGRIKGVPQTESLRVVERFTMIDANTIEYQATLDDPAMFARPWTVSVPLHRDSSYRVYEYACHEGNRAVEGMLRGARSEETRK